MRGTSVYPFRPPELGLIANKPPHLVPEGALIDGLNCFLDIDGLYKPRFGFGAWKATSPDQPLLGMLWYTDIDGSAQYVGVSTQNAYALINGAWTKVSTTMLNGVNTDLIRIVDYLQSTLSADLSAIFTNNHDPIQVWNRSFVASQPLTPTLIAAGTDNYTVATTPTFPSYPVNQQFFVRVLNANTRPATTGTQTSVPTNKIVVATTTGFVAGMGVQINGAGPAGANLITTITGTAGTQLTLADNLVTSVTNTPITGLSALSMNGLPAIPWRYLVNGVVTELPATYLIPGVIYNVAYDGTQFLIGTFVQAPVARDICVLNGRLVAVNIQYGGVRSPSQVVWSSAFDATSWPPLAFQNLLDTDDPLIAVLKIGVNAAIVYGEESAWLMQGVYAASDAGAFQFTPIPSAIVGPVSPLAIGQSGDGAHKYLARDKRIWSCDGSTAQPVSDPIDAVLAADVSSSAQTQAFTLYHPAQRQLWFFYVPSNGALSAPSHAVIMAERNGSIVFEPVQHFAAAITSAATVVADTGTTWAMLTQPWSAYNVPWSSFLSGQELIALICANGIVSNFGASFANDNGATVPYYFIPALMNAGPGEDLLMDSLEVFLKPTTTEFGTVQIDSLQSPMAETTPITSWAFDCADSETYALRKSLPKLNIYSRYLRLMIMGVSNSRALAFGGAQIFFNPQKRPSA